jgi:VWFA-related protein
MKNRRHVGQVSTFLSAAILLLLSVRVLAQAPSPRPQNQSPPAAATLRVTTRVVQVSVIAQDGDGHPIIGLTRDDFKILDNGTEQKIVSFSQHSGRLTASATPAVIPVSANTFSNRVDEKTGVPPSVTVILLDALNTDFQDMASARGQVVKFLRQIHPEDRVALYELTTKLIVLHDFTSDTATLLRALGEAPNPQSGAPNETLQITADTEAGLMAGGKGSIPAPDPGWLTAAMQREDVFDKSNKAEGTTDAFTQIAHHLARLPGRKNLVWVSGSFPFNVDWDPTTRSEAPSFASQINLSAQALSDANVAIYPVDARGLMAQRIAEGGVLFARTRPGAPPQNTLDTMQKLAQGTGGLANYNTNGIAEAIRHAIDDSSLTYELTYYPTNEKWDGRFRDIKVEVKRPGVHLRYRKGYFATPATPPSAETQARLLTAAARDPLEATQLGLNVQVNAVDAPGPRQVKVEVRVDPDQLHFDLNAGRWNDNVEIAWVELNEKGADVGHSAKILTLSYPDQGHDKIVRDGFTFGSTIGLVDDCVELRLVARDGGTGAIGSVNIPLTRIFIKAGAGTSQNR